MQVGVTLYEVRHVIVRDLVIQGFQLDGVNAHDGVRETTLSALNCRGKGAAESRSEVPRASTSMRAWWVTMAPPKSVRKVSRTRS